jgi:hypothetical protein
MKRILFILSFITFNASFSFGQWNGVGGEINSPIGWSNNYASSSVSVMAVYNGNLYVGGNFDSAGGKPASNIAMWNGTTWTPIGSGINSSVRGLVVYNGNLYVGGYFDSAGGKPASNIAMWNGTSWAPVGSGITQGGVSSLIVYNGNLYAGGWFDSAGGKPAKNIAVWNGTTWAPVGTGVINDYGVACMAVYNSNLYVGGSFDSAGGKPTSAIAMWNGTSWGPVGSGIQYNSLYSGGPQVLSLATYNGSLYAGGYFDTAGGKPASDLAAWNGTTWTGSLGNINGWVESLFDYDSELCVGGYFYNVAGINNTGGIAAWNGTKWEAIGSGVNGHCWLCLDTNIQVRALVSYNSSLYAAGYFDSIGGLRVNSMGRWVGPLGINEIQDNKNSYTLYPNPATDKLFIEGTFEGNKSISVYNVVGQQVISMEGQGKQITLNTSALSTGMYFVQVKEEQTGKISVLKFIKE